MKCIDCVAFFLLPQFPCKGLPDPGSRLRRSESDSPKKALGGVIVGAL
jgi:hypothetical protein